MSNTPTPKANPTPAEQVVQLVANLAKKSAYVRSAETHVSHVKTASAAQSAVEQHKILDALTLTTTRDIVKIIADVFVNGGDRKTLAASLQQVARDPENTGIPADFPIYTLHSIAESACKYGTSGRHDSHETLQDQLRDYRETFDAVIKFDAHDAQHLTTPLTERAIRVLDNNNAHLTEEFRELAIYCTARLGVLAATQPELTRHAVTHGITLNFVDRVLTLQDEHDITPGGTYRPHDLRTDPARPTLGQAIPAPKAAKPA